MNMLKEHVAVITGASGGIGRAISLGLVHEGMRVCIVGRNPETLKAISLDDPGNERQVRPFQADLSLDGDIEKFVSFLQRDFSHIDVLIHSAGAFSMGSIENTPVKELDRLYQINLRAPYILTQALLPMLKSVQGQVVFINSSVGFVKARANLSQYVAIKHGLKALADSLRDEVNAEGVRVLSVYPGRTASPMQAFVHQLEGLDYLPERLLQPENVARVIIEALTMPRSAEITDISIRPLMKS